MFARVLSRGTQRALVALVILAVCVSVGFLQPAAAQSSLKESTSLGFVPDNVAFYGTMLRNKEQYDTLVGSKAFAALKEIEVVKQAIAQFEAALQTPQGPLAGLNSFLNDDNFKDIRETLVDMVSSEVFFYGDESYGDLAVVIGQINSANRMAGVQAQLAGGGGNPMQQLSLMLRAMNEHRDKLHVPGTLVGFRLQDPARGKTQLKQLAEVAGALLGQKPELADRFKTTEIDGDEFLTLKLDGEMIPWDQVPIAALEQEPGEFNELVATIKKMPLTISLGVRGDYMLLGIAESDTIVKKTSEGKLLHDRDEMAALRDNADKKLVQIGYVDGEFAKKANQMQQQLDDMVAMVESLVPMVPFDDDVKKELADDIKSLRDSVVPMLPEPGAQAGFAYLTDRGYEGYTYDWGDNKFLDGSKKLSLLEHVGGDPILYFAGRSKYSPDRFNVVVRFLKRGYYYLDKYASMQLAGDNLQRYTTYRDAALPQIERLEKITSEKVIPAFQDGQGALVIDAKAKSKSWSFFLPASTKPLPMLEAALVYGVSDAAMLKKGVDEYFEVVEDLLAALHKAAPDEVPEIPLPEVATEKSDVGTISYFEILNSLPVDSQLRPNAGLSDSVAVVSLTPGQTKRLLTSTPPEPKDGPIANHDGPLAMAAHLNWPGLIDAVEPWIGYVLKNQADSRAAAQSENDKALPGDVSSSGDDSDKPAEKDGEKSEKEAPAEKDGAGPQDIEAILAQIHAGAEVLKCFHGYSSISYFEKEVRVTHHESVFHDLEK